MHKGLSLQIPEDMQGLPVQVVTPSDVGRILRELETVDNVMLQASLNGKTGTTKLTGLTGQTAHTNKIDMSLPEDRKRLTVFLKQVKQSAPVLHISFSADPQMPFLEKLVAWLRSEIHPLVLVKIGLQPNIGAGCVVRSTNKYFDMSLRKDFEKSKQNLLSVLENLNKIPLPATPTVAVPATATPQTAAATAAASATAVPDQPAVAQTQKAQA